MTYEPIQSLMPPPDTTGIELAARGVGHQFQPTWWCLREIDLVCRPGELIGLVGPNGSGKSTLMRALAGQLAPTAGDVQLAGKSLGRFSPRERARAVAWLPQDVRPTFDFTVEEIVAQGRYPHIGPLGVPGPHDREVVQLAMAWTRTLAFARRPLAELSGGERQSVLLASVLAQQSRFLLLDEPTSALDLHHQIDVFEQISDLAHAGLGVIVITHDLNLAARYCDRLALLHEGRLVADGAPTEVMREPILRQAYDVNLMVEPNPVVGSPMVVLLGRRGGAR
ncbi:ABC transporter ATP-binding protein [bacterium]|nr:ABC transporter ATP-binding protein [bacterium]